MTAPAPRRRRRRLWWLVVPALAAAGTVAFVLRPDRGPTQRVLVETVEGGTFVREVSGTGVVEPAQERGLGFAGAGTVAEVRVKDGRRVGAGDVLARLDTASTERELASTRAALASATADLERVRAQQSVDRLDLDEAVSTAADSLAGADAALADATRTRDLARELVAAGAVSRSELDAAETTRDRAERARRQAAAGLDAARARLDNVDQLARAQLASGEANVERLNTSLAQLRQQLDEAELIAPFDGVVTSVPFEVGDVVGPPAGPTLRLVDDSSVSVTARFDESRALELAPGQSATVTPDAAPDLRLPATVTRVSPVAERGQASAQLAADLVFGPATDSANGGGATGVDGGGVPPEPGAPGASVRPGYTVTVRVVVNRLEGELLVPLEAIVDDAGDAAVFRVVDREDGHGTVERVPVTVLDRNATMAAVRGNEALAAGDGIAVTNLGELEEGAHVSFDAGPSGAP